jgi:hypothetical protein
MDMMLETNVAGNRSIAMTNISYDKTNERSEVGLRKCVHQGFLIHTSPNHRKLAPDAKRVDRLA